ncbi:MAG: NADH-quinone oxidoreductase subunit NuoN [Actinomycetota bacterium]|nr:NADH-quinone oxidoreductase subunit NuoN [Actinomycetota bacterium]
MNVGAPSIEYGLLSPMLIVLGAAVLGVLVEAFAARRHRYRAQMSISLAALVAAFVAVVVLARGLGDGNGATAVLGAVAVDRPALFLQGTIALIGVLGVLLIGERRVRAPGGGSASGEDGPDSGGLDAFTPQASVVAGGVAEKEATRAGLVQTEVFPLTLFAVGGMMLFGAANDLLTMFVALEVLSLPLYLLCGLARRRRLLSQEAAMKYFLLGAFSSAFFLYGAAMLYGYAGTLRLGGIADAVAAGAGKPALALLGAALVLVGVLFKVGAVPFHSWIPDVYQGAPTPITAFMAAATKIAAFGALLRVFYVALPELRDDWQPVLWAVAILTMLVGTITAVTQTDVKRILAYSAVAHSGFILTGVIAGSSAGLSSTLFYLFAYGFSTVGAFAVVALVRDGDGDEDTAISRWAGLGKRYPVVGMVFSLFLLAFAGIPLTSGFVSKFAVFKAAGESGAIGLVVVGVIASAIAAYFYVRVIVLMFFTDRPADAPTVVVPSVLTGGVIAVTAAVTFALGALPQPLLDLADAAGRFL